MRRWGLLMPLAGVSLLCGREIENYPNAGLVHEWLKGEQLKFEAQQKK